MESVRHSDTGIPPPSDPTLHDCLATAFRHGGPWCAPGPYPEAEKKKQRQKRTLEISERMKLSEEQQPQDFIDPRDTRPFLIKALKMLKNKKRQLPPRKHGNIRL